MFISGQVALKNNNPKRYMGNLFSHVPKMYLAVDQN